MLNNVPRVLKDFAVYIDGNRYAGQVKQITLPKITIKKENHRVGYMNVPITLGMEPLETTISMVEQTKSVFLLMGILNNTTGNLVTFRGYQEGEGGLLANNEIVIQMRGIFTEIDLGSHTRGTMPEYRIQCSIMQYTYIQDKIPLIVIDPYTNTFIVGGTDQLLMSKKALGIL